ncbi:hypothetical protein [Sediminibacillus halophilus]|uniref:Uncharacterized protein n=1 Tax=Sediminibacillus halophilus TaxID=482461 RepID=A0A1G9W4I6_9BACI|nr:hypothetical protein [Sediminibacillus halophilus]SDM79213.1 hypothetical protein SAMN05216244_3418 [Sediminibacillus halophilus]
MDSYVLQQVVGQKEAVRSIKQHQNNLIAKWQRLFRSGRQLTSIELIHLPYWCFSYEYRSKQMKDPIRGRVAVETYRHHTAILPESAQYRPTTNEASLLAPCGGPVPEVARDEIYWEAFSREKKRKDIAVDILETAVLYVPYWIGYLQGDTIDIVAVDAANGKIDLGIKDSLLEAIMATSK